MASNMLRFLNFRNTVGILTLGFFLSASTCSGITISLENVQAFNSGEFLILSRKIEELSKSKDIFKESTQFLEDLIKEINKIYNTSFTLDEVLELSKERIKEQNVSPEIVDSFSTIVKEFEYQENVNKNKSGKLVVSYKKRRDKHKKPKPGQCCLRSEPPKVPAAIVIGAVEVCAGTILVLIPLIATQTVGSIMIGDGATRMLGETQKISDEREAATPKN